MYNSTDYINYDVFNEIEDRIEQLTCSIQFKNNDIPIYEKNIWFLNDWIYLEKVKNIEQGIENLRKYYVTPTNWNPIRQWQRMASFSYMDINRWLKNLDAIEKVINEYEFRYAPEFYCGEEVSL